MLATVNVNELQVCIADTTRGFRSPPSNSVVVLNRITRHNAMAMRTMVGSESSTPKIMLLVLAGANTNVVAQHMAPMVDPTAIRLKKTLSCPEARYEATNRPNVPGRPSTASGAARTKKLLESAQSPSCSSAKKRQRMRLRTNPTPRCNRFATSMNERPETNESACKLRLGGDRSGSELNMAMDIRSFWLGQE